MNECDRMRVSVHVGDPVSGSGTQVDCPTRQKQAKKCIGVVIRRLYLSNVPLGERVRTKTESMKFLLLVDRASLLLDNLERSLTTVLILPTQKREKQKQHRIQSKKYGKKNCKKSCEIKQFQPHLKRPKPYLSLLYLAGNDFSIQLYLPFTY